MINRAVICSWGTTAENFVQRRLLHFYEQRVYLLGSINACEVVELTWNSHDPSSVDDGWRHARPNPGRYTGKKSWEYRV